MSFLCKSLPSAGAQGNTDGLSENLNWFSFLSGLWNTAVWNKSGLAYIHLLWLVKGLSLRLYGGVSFPRNQIQLSKSELSTEDILLRQHELQSNYSFWANFGFSYTIGSIYNNIVNPRFDE